MADGSGGEEENNTEPEKDKTEAVLAEEKGTIAVTYVKSPLNVPSIVEKDQQIFAK